MGTRSYIRNYGGNGELVVLLHGFLGSKDYWSKLGPLLAKAGYRAVALDLLGFGNAPKPKNLSYSYEDHIQHIEYALGKLTPHEPFVLVGHSMGALLATRYALKHPSQVKKLVLLHPPLYMTPSQASDTLRNTGRLYRFLLDSRYRNVAWPVMRMLLLGRMRHSRRSREYTLRNVIESAEIFEDLRKLQGDTLLLVGHHDRPVYIHNLKLMEIPNTVTVVKTDISHHSPIWQPEKVRKIMLEFLSPSVASRAVDSRK